MKIVKKSPRKSPKKSVKKGVKKSPKKSVKKSPKKITRKYKMNSKRCDKYFDLTLDWDPNNWGTYIKDIDFFKKTNKYKIWIKNANEEYSSKKDIQNIYQKKLDDDTRCFEQAWVWSYLTPLMEFMGDPQIWDICFGITIKTRGSSRSKTSSNYNKPDAVYSGSHWRSRRINQDKFFDPYDKFQAYGTNQFCQTFAMMNLLDELPKIYTNEDPWTKYYRYTNLAIKFINKFVKRTKVSQFIKQNGMERMINTSIKECLKYPNICLNSIEFPSF